MSRPLSCVVVCLALAGFAGTARAADSTPLEQCDAVASLEACQDIADLLAASNVLAYDATKGQWTQAMSKADGMILGAKLIEGFNAAIGARFGELEARLAGFQGDLLSYTQQVVALEEFAVSGFTRQQGRIEALEDKIGDPNFDKLIAEGDEYFRTVDRLQEELTVVNDKTDDLGGQVGKLGEFVATLNDFYPVLESRVSDIEAGGAADRYAAQCRTVKHGAGPDDKKVGLCCFSLAAAEATGATSFVAADELTEADLEAIFGQGARYEMPVWNAVDATAQEGRMVINPGPEDFEDPDAILFDADEFAEVLATPFEIRPANGVSTGSRVALAESGLRDQQRQLGFLDEYVEDGFENLGARADGTDAEIGALGTRVAALEEGVPYLKVEFEAIVITSMAKVQDSVDVLTGRVDKIESSLVGLWSFDDQIAQDTSSNRKDIDLLQGQIGDLTKQVDGLRTELHGIQDSFTAAHTVRVAYVASTAGGITFDAIDVADVAMDPGAKYTVDFAGFDAIDVLNGVTKAPCSEVKGPGGVVMFDEKTPLKICVGRPDDWTPGIGWIDLSTAHTLNNGTELPNLVITLAESSGGW